MSYKVIPTPSEIAASVRKNMISPQYKHTAFADVSARRRRTSFIHLTIRLKISWIYLQNECEPFLPKCLHITFANRFVHSGSNNRLTKTAPTVKQNAWQSEQ